MSYIDRLRPDVKLTSPDGDVFTALWSGDDVSKNKKLGIFDFPNFDGSIVQDLGVNANSYPLTIHFSGDDNDIEASRFYASCDQRGVWKIVHSTEGNLNLQLVSIKREIRPIESGNITFFDTVWIEPASVNTQKSAAQLGAEVLNQAENANATAGEQYSENISENTASELIANEQAVSSAVLNTNNSLENITSLSDTISAEITAITASINENLSNALLDSSALAGQVQLLAQLPALATNDIQSRVNAYLSLNDTMFELVPEDNNSEAKNTANVIELSTTASLIAVSKSIVTGDLDTRENAINYINTLFKMLDDITNNLDTVQKNFEGNSIDTQYFSNSAAYSDLLRLVALTSEYLIRSSLDLKIAKRFTLDRPRSPIEITVSEYGSLGDADENIDFFIASNNLIGNDIKLLQAGREVVVYV